MTIGAIYIVTHDPRYVGLLASSCASLKAAMPDLPVTVFSQFPVESPLFEKVVPVVPTEGGFYDKARLMLESPYDRTLFVDADITFLQAVPELFTLLGRFDCAATHEEYLSTDWRNSYPRADIPQSFPEFNTGILAFRRSPAMQHLLSEWSNLYRQYLQGKPGDIVNDQPFFRAAAYSGEARIATLSREYNCKFRGQGYLNGKVKVLHGHVNFQMKPSHVGQAEKVLNRSVHPRVYIAGQVFEQKVAGRLVARRMAHKVGSFPELPEPVLRMRARRLKQVVKEQGVGATLAKIFAVR
jgi:hypothetical protein